MVDFSSLFRPLTAQPFQHASAVHSSYLPCEELKPFVALFWGSERPTDEWSPIEYEPSLIIPDACVDIIFTVDHMADTIEGGFYGIYDRPSVADAIKGRPNVSRFAIRFYFWAAQYFSGSHMRGSYGIAGVSVDEYFTGWASFFKDMLIRTRTLKERVALTERHILKSLNQTRPNSNVMNALHSIITTRGTVSVQDLCDDLAVSRRHLERLFLEYIGMPVKKTANLVRYQSLWRDIAYSQIVNIQDAVEKYQYADQSHLVNDFKKYHTVPPGQAIQIACR